MVCRLCLCSAPSEASVSILETPRILHLVRLCQLNVTKGDRLPPTVCLTCVNNLELLDSFRNVCLQSDRVARLSSNFLSNIKSEEVFPDDSIWENEVGSNKTSNISNPTNNVKICKGKISSCDNESKETSSIPSVYICDICSKSFLTKSQLEKHSKITHSKSKNTQVKPHKCDICLKSFRRPFVLAQHINNHTGEKPHKCDFCSKSFGSRSNLIRHTNIHTKLKIYQCDICSISFSQNSNLNKHMKTHTRPKPYTCDICSDSFTKKSSLGIHMFIHNKAKPPKCGICFKLFFTKSALYRHLKIHT